MKIPISSHKFKKTQRFLICIFCCVGLQSYASDLFPSFNETPFTITIPTNMIGYQSDADHIVGSNVVYNLVGQIFTNVSSGHIQTLAEGFSGTNTDKSTPWKTLTELLAVYQQGANSNSIIPLYTSSSQSFFDSIYTNSTVAQSYQSFATSITNMSVLMGYEVSNGIVGITAYNYDTNFANYETLPFFFITNNGEYFISTFDNADARESNIGTFLNTHSVTNLIQ